MAKAPANRYSTWSRMAHDLTTAHSQLELPSENVSDTEQFNLLKSLEFFNNFSDVELWEVVRVSSWRKFKSERSLIREGKIGDSLFILASGEARIMKNGSFLGLVESGQCFGEMAYIHGKKKARSASVISNSDVISDHLKPEDAVYKNPEVMKTVYQTADERRRRPCLHSAHQRPEP